MKASARIGILGGTFDPIHNGHLAIAEAARGCLGLDRVVFIPAGRPWLKARSLGRITDAEHRLAMVRLATANCPHFEASAMEIERPGLTYTVDTLAELRAKDDGSSRGTEMYLILGMDSVRELRRWHEPERLLEMCVVVAVSRPDTDEVSPSSFERGFSGFSKQVRASQGAYAETSAPPTCAVGWPKGDLSATACRRRWSGTSETTVFTSERSIMCIANPYPVEVCRR